MVERIIRIILTGIVLADDRVRSQIQKQAGVPSDQAPYDLIKMVYCNDHPDDNERAYPQAAAPICRVH